MSPSEEIGLFLAQYRLNPATFKIALDISGTELEFVPLNEEVAPEIDKDDLVAIMVNNQVYQRFDTSSLRYSINEAEITARILEQIVIKMRRFVLNNLNTAKPRQTKLYRFLNRNSSPPVVEGLYLLFKYVAPYCTDSMIYTATDDTHKKNAFLILEAMQKRYS